jgi:hypothetical protein
MASPWPARDDELLALAHLPGDQIAVRMDLSLGSINGRLGRLKRRGVAIERPPPQHAGCRRAGSLDGVTPTWPAEAIAYLRAERTNLTTEEMAAHLGKIPRAIRHKAFLLNLPPAKRPPRVTAPKVTHPKRLTPLALNRPLRSPPRAPDRSEPPQTVYQAPREIACQPPRPRRGPVIECCWPIGDPGKRDFRCCDEPSEPGLSYCAKHHQRSRESSRGHAAPMAGTGALLFSAPDAWE